MCKTMPALETRAGKVADAFHNDMPRDTYEDELARWQFAKAQKQLWDKQEKELRLALFGGAVPAPKEGVNNVELQDGRICKFTHKVNRTFTDPTECMEDLRNIGVNDVETYVKVKYEVAVGPYKKAGGDIRKVLDKYVISKPGMCELEIK